MRQTIDNLEDRIAEADSLEELISLRYKVNALFKEVTPTNEREFVPKLCELEEGLTSRIDRVVCLNAWWKAQGF